MKVDSWEDVMDVIDINGDGMISLNELERWVLTLPKTVTVNWLTNLLFWGMQDYFLKT